MKTREGKKSPPTSPLVSYHIAAANHHTSPPASPLPPPLHIPPLAAARSALPALSLASPLSPATHLPMPADSGGFRRRAALSRARLHPLCPPLRPPALTRNPPPWLGFRAPPTPARLRRLRLRLSRASQPPPPGGHGVHRRRRRGSSTTAAATSTSELGRHGGCRSSTPSSAQIDRR